ncbi:LysR family transcriptional regulator [Leuconostocaceae bacterium ESL0958]|nr:LysR family transcriptional regulator [Leuconostocaceae bacterium ESL0958]
MNRLLVLATIIQKQSFTKAAEALGYTQSSVSQMVAALEKEFGMKILRRSRNGISLTPEGERLYPSIIQTLRQYEALHEQAAAINGLHTGTVRIGVITSVSCYWLPEIFKAFQQDYPQIDFVLQLGDYGMITNWLAQGEIDFGLMTADYGHGFQKIPLHETEMKAILPVDHPLAEAAHFPIEAFADEPFLMIEGGGYSEPQVAFDQAGIQPSVQYRIQDDYTIMAMVEAGLGLSILSELVATRSDFKIVTKSIQPKVKRPVAIVYQNKEQLPVASQRFIDFLIAHQDQLR